MSNYSTLLYVVPFPSVYGGYGGHGGGDGGMRLKKTLPTTNPHTHVPPVEAECMVDDRVFAGICEPHVPE